ncbi:MAG: 4-alpha-glucanotransferase, partial [Rhodospirillaceae bacterium]
AVAARRSFAVAAPGSGAVEESLTPETAAAIHAGLARAPSRLLGVQFEDLCGATEPVNIPGTSTEYANWRLRAPIGLEDVAAGEMWNAVLGAVAHERPRPA